MATMKFYKVLYVIVLLTLVKIISTVSDDFNQQPQIQTNNGKLIIRAAPSRNITFRVKGEGGIFINSVNILKKIIKKNAQLRPPHKDKDTLTTQSVRSYLNALKSDLLVLGASFGALQNRTRGMNIRRSLGRVLRAHMRATRIESGLMVNECKDEDKNDTKCKNGGTCYTGYKNFHCECPSGWTGKTCEEDVDECYLYAGTDLGCQNSGDCINTLGSFRCSCRNGFYGTHCRIRKVACEEAGNEELCDHGTCVSANNDAGYSCICDQGWTKNKVIPEAACNIDINECDEATNPCHSECVNLPGSFKCSPCPNGYTGNGISCLDIDECSINNGGCSMRPKVSCINTEGSYHCGNCPVGWEGDGRICESSAPESCASKNICYPGAKCEYISNTVVCTCPPGMFGHGFGADGCSVQPIVNPCTNHTCQNNARCEVIGGGTRCFCTAGFLGPTCDQPDACQSKPCLNGGSCTLLLNNQYRCSCPRGTTGRNCEIVRDICGSIIRMSAGSLSYPPSGGNYLPNERCAWIIRTDNALILNVTISTFDLEAAADCNKDWLQIHDGRSLASRLIGRFCGKSLPLGGNILTTQNSMFFWFRSDNETTGAGFNLTWNSIEYICGEVLNNASGLIRSPGYPGKTPPSRDCEWKLNAPFGNRFILRFFEINLGSTRDNNCTRDTVTIYDSDLLLRSVCEPSLIEPLYSSSNRIRLLLHTDAYGTDSSFQLHYEVVPSAPNCGGVFTEATGIITGYINGRVCLYLIQQPIGTKIKLEFTNVDLLRSEDCFVQKIQVFDGDTDENNLLKTLCGKQEDIDSITSSSNVVLLLYEYLLPSVSLPKNFEIKYTRVCNSEIQSSDAGFLTTPNYPNSYYEHMECTFIIRGPANSVVHVNFTDFSISKDEAHTDSDEASLFTSNNATIDVDGTFVDVYLTKDVKQRYYEGTFLHLVSERNVVSIVFHGGSNKQKGRGIRVEYHFEKIKCGGILTQESGYFPLLRATGETVEDCELVIEAPKGKHIKLDLHMSYLNMPPPCSPGEMDLAIYSNDTSSEGQLLMSSCHKLQDIHESFHANIITIFLRMRRKEYLIIQFTLRYEIVDNNAACGGTFTAQYGAIKTPSWPQNYDDSLNCTWIIEAPLGHKIELITRNFSVETTSKNCNDDYLEIRNGKSVTSPLIGIYCGNTIPERIPSFANYLYLNFISDSYLTDKGFYLTWQQTATGCGGRLTSYTGSIHSPHNSDINGGSISCDWQITVSRGSTIIIYISLAGNNMNLCNQTILTINDGLTLSSPQLKFNCVDNSTTIQLKTSSNQALIIYNFKKTSVNAGLQFVLDYETNCNAKLDNLQGVIESPNFPDNYPPNLNCFWDIHGGQNNKFQLIFSHLENEIRDEACNFDYIEIFDLRNDDVLSKQHLCSNPLKTINTEGNRFQVKFVTDYSDHAKGFRLEYKRIGCGGLLTGNYGHILSPNSPYSIGMNCDWEIEVDAGKRIVLNFDEIHIETESGDCSEDAITVSDEKNSTAYLLKECRIDQVPVTITSSSNRLHIHFYTSTTRTRKYISATYRVRESSCGGIFRGNSGQIRYPTYADATDGNTNCVWSITVENSYGINIVFDSFNISCSSTFLSIWDAGAEEDKLVQKTCGSTLPESRWIQSNRIKIIYKASESSWGTFSFKFKKACGGLLNDTFGYIKSRWDENCEWRIESEGSKIFLDVLHLECDCSNQANCTNGLRLINGNDKSELNNFCDNHQTNIILPTNALNIVATKIELKAKYSIVKSSCGGTLTSLRGILTSPYYPQSYPSNIECVWEIKASVGNYIELNINELDIVKSENCNEDFLEIRQTNELGKIKQVFCSNEAVTDKIVVFEKAWLKFRSIDGNTANGFKLQWNYVHNNELNSTTGSIESPPLKSIRDQEPFSWRITLPRGNFIFIEFKIYNLGLKLYDGFDDLALEIPIQNSPWQFTSSSSVLYLVSNNYELDAFKIVWKTVNNSLTQRNSTNGDCNETFNINYGIRLNISSPGYPNGYANDLDCEWIIKSTDPIEHVVLSIYEVKLESFGESDYLRIFSSVNLRDWHKELDMFDSRDMSLVPVKVVHGTPYLKLLLHTDSSVNGSGFTSLAKTGCGANMTDLTGQIVAKNVMRSWSSNSVCIWHIEVQAGKRIAININFGKNVIPKTQDCRQYAVIYDGFDDNAPIIPPGRICNQMGQNVKNLESSTNRLTIKYNLNWTTPFEKDLDFNLTYQQIGDCNTEIQLTHYLNVVNISSPNYPNVPNPHTECNWIIIGPVGETLHAEFIESFSFNTRYCDKEFIEFFDGSTELSRSLGRFCTKPNAIRSSGNILRVHYLTDINEPRNGFRLNISIAACGGTYANLNGEITSSGYPTPGAYPKPSVCEYTIKMPYSARISLNFTDFDLHYENTNLNRSDRIEVTTISEEPETVAVLYGNTTTKPVLEVDYSVVKLRFVTFSTTQRHRGFKLKYRRLFGSCYRDVEDTPGVITLKLKERSPIFLSCRWKIKVPKGQRVTIEFDKLEAETVNNSTDRFITGVTRYPSSWTTKMLFFNDPDMLSKITEINLNNFNLSEKIRSSDNFMHIRIDINRRIATIRKLELRYSSDEESLCPPDINEQVFGSINTNELPSNVNFFCNSKFVLSGFETMTFKIKELLVYRSNRLNYPYAIRFKDERTLMAYKILYTNATDTTVSISSKGGMLSILQNDMLQIRRFSVDFYRHACGGSFRVFDDVKIVFPTENFVHNGDESPIECSWTITGSGEGRPYKLVGNLSLGNDCSKEYISIRSRMTPDLTEIIKLCHNSTELTTGITLKQSFITILYSTSKYRSSSTFQITAEASIACGTTTRVLTNTPIVSVNPKTYKNNMECSWEFETSSGLFMTVEFTGRFFIEKSVNCSKDYLQIYAYEDEVWQPKERYCGRDVPNSYNATSNRILIVFRTDNTTRGDGFTFRISPSCTVTFNVTDQLQIVQTPSDETTRYSRHHCSYTFLTSSDNAINLHIRGNALSFPLSQYYVNSPCPYASFTAYKKDDDGNEIESGEYCGSADINEKHYLRLRTNVFYDTFLVAYQLDKCGGNISTYAIIRPLMAAHTGGDTNVYANNMNCVWNVMAPPDHSIVIRFKYFHMENNDRCIFDFVAIYAGASARPDNELAKLCGNLTANPPLVLVDGRQAVITAVSDISGAHKGFMAEVIFARNCNERIALTNDDTMAQPPIMIRNYTVNPYEELHCQIRVTAPDSYRVKVQVRNLNINSVKCTNNKCEECNYLEVIEGVQKSEILSMGKFCVNDDGRRKLVTSDENALLQFSFTIAGNYSVELVLEIEKSLCDEQNEIQLTSDKAVSIKFPPYNNSEYSPNAHCKWRIKSERDYQIHFEYLLLQPPDSETGKCNDFLRLTHQETTEYYCGNTTGFTKYISSQENDDNSYTELTFHSDDSVEDKGFNITISHQQPCNHTYTRLSGLIDFKSEENSNQTCFEDIRVPNDYVLNFNILGRTSYHSGTNCSAPNLEINDTITNKTLLKQCISYYYGENLHTNASAIHMYARNLDGFHVFYFASKKSSGIGCGGEIQTMKGVISSPSYDNRNFSECRWDIIVPEPRHVQLNFLTFDMGSEVNCEFDYVNIVEVSSNGEENVAKNICADQDVYNFVTKTSKVAIVSKKSPNFNGNGWTLSFRVVSY